MTIKNVTWYRHLALIRYNLNGTTVTQFRLISNRLEIERGRFQNISRDNRQCKFCNLNVVESEYHFSLICLKTYQYICILISL